MHGLCTRSAYLLIFTDHRSNQIVSLFRANVLCPYRTAVTVGRILVPDVKANYYDNYDGETVRRTTDPCE